MTPPSPGGRRPRGPRGMILAAGLGTRLRPLTDQIPKPLLPVLGKPVLAHSLDRLAAAGCEAVAINLHHRGELIRERFGDSYKGMPLTWSVEPRLLGTLGALEPLHGFFAGAEMLLLINGDSLCRWPLAELAAHQRASGAAATLLLSSRAAVRDFAGGVEVDRRGRVVSLRPARAVFAGAVRRAVFAGAHALSPDLLGRIAARPAAVAEPGDIVRDLYEPLLAERPGALATWTTRRRWHDLGTPSRFLAAVLDWLLAAARSAGPAGSGAPPLGGTEDLFEASRRSGRWIDPAADLAADVSVRRSSLEGGCRVGRGSQIEDSVLLPGAVVGTGCIVRGSILGPDAVLAPGTEVSHRLLAGGRSVPIDGSDRGAVSPPT